MTSYWWVSHRPGVKQFPSAGSFFSTSLPPADSPSPLTSGRCLPFCWVCVSKFSLLFITLCFCQSSPLKSVTSDAQRNSAVVAASIQVHAFSAFTFVFAIISHPQVASQVWSSSVEPCSFITLMSSPSIWLEASLYCSLLITCMLVNDSLFHRY